MRTVRVPFRQAGSPPTVESWQLNGAEGPIELPEEHANWDPTIDIEVSRKINVDGARLRDECSLVDDARVRLLAGWQSENGRSKEFPWRYDLRLPSSFEGTIELRIPGAKIATSV